MTSPAVLRIRALPLLILPTTGCFWPGHTLSRGEIQYAHPSVQWVYHTGGQVGHVMGFVWPVEHMVHGLEADRDRVILWEGPYGCIDGGIWQPTYALDLRTGRPAAVRRPQSERPFSYQFEDTYVGDGILYRVDEHTSLYSPIPWRELYAGPTNEDRRAYTRILALRGNQYDLGGVHHAARPREHILVFNAGYEHVICLDLSRLPGRVSASRPE